VLAFPVAVAGAKPGHGNGNGGERGQGHGVENRSDDRRPNTEQREGRRAARRCKRTHSVGFVVKGSLASFTAESVTLDVKRANRHARGYIKTAGSTFTLGAARVRFVGVTDGDSSGTVDLADVQPTDKVVAVGKATRPKRGCEGEVELKLRKLQIVRPQAQESDDSAGESEQS
jgi:hypothetical protein